MSEIEVKIPEFTLYLDALIERVEDNGVESFNYAVWSQGEMLGSGSVDSERDARRNLAELLAEHLG